MACTRLSKCVFQFIGALCIIIYAGTLIRNFSKDDGFLVAFTSLQKKDTTELSPIDSILKEQARRFEILHQTFRKYQHLTETKLYRKFRPVYMAAPKYHWTVCKSGKVGSTFWSQFFYILTRNGGDVKKIRALTREDLHIRFTSNSLTDPRSYPTRLIVAARNPYLRLFSAYIDRIYTPSTTHIALKGNTNKCDSQITFTGFLQHVIDSYHEGMYDYHWTPLYHQCRPCEIEPAYIVKMETFTQDFAFIINQTKLEPYKKEVWDKTLSEQGEFAISTLIDDVLDFVAPENVKDSRDCQNMKQITLRVWQAMKIQGYIAERAPFPFHRYKNEKDFKNSNIFRDILVETRYLYPMTKADVALQRQNSLNTFYGEVEQDLIDGIQTMYSADFELFGYSLDPPPW